ncbi:NAD(P)-dependent oxidoreductase [Mucilaginibacter sp. KACC 22773]|jgi:nucleoside-diphosphate-sugar epimerase|uniref:NAD-dependent epimerase/dehydratase family protein n=1 Tax=Mucilaginibacter sp. KACC 22773 TaxID=3025671 RepID=UPI002365B136|nr:NAD(P)-dependent oxidoreductase [Mucilaginibacter sp. KACC 22773]WDF78228.1 NAD(P)-dependent oxidoreductase [Mucilaginibacter sp. KACC 22773]
MKILVTGSSGQLGSATVKHLKAFGHHITGVDVIPAATTDDIIDIKNKSETENLCRGFDAIIHTAAVHGKHYELNYPREAFIQTNIIGTLNLLNACVKHGVNRFLYTSTTSIYGSALIDHEKAVWVDENLPEKPRDIYDITKQTTEQLCKDFFYKEGLQTSVYRVGRFLPEEDNLKINHRIYRGLDERDGAEALRLALGITFADFEIFNISSGSPFGKDDLVQLKYNPEGVILKFFPEAKDIYRRKNWFFPESIDRVYVCNKAKQILGYQPQFDFEYLLHQ